ncbi:MAG: glycerol-3-phosphate acyltransferase [Akkermansiaceae bacterium]|nr:glycerol-3-phosphate acyltransferase [Verrucomicrobiales bacterium]
MSWIDQWHSANWNLAGILCLFAYILGCFTSGYYLVRWLAHKDIRQIGSGSVGARNVSRVLGKKGFFLTVIFDFAKGILAVLIARHFTHDDRLVLLAMAAVIAGHVWPVQLRFHGGKGMATSVGALLIFNPELALAFTILFLCLVALMRKTVLPGLFALACVPLVDFWLNHNPTGAILLSLCIGLVLLAHRRNFIEEFSQFAARRHPQPEQPPL